MAYSFYIQKYSYDHFDSESGAYKTEPKGKLLDIEKEFKCNYVRFEGINETGKVKNVYTESYAETEELRVFHPENVLYENTDVTLTLLFPIVSDNEMDVQNFERKFFEYVSGRKIEYHDTFRNRYLTLILINKPELVNEVLYGGSRYRQVKYTFKNIYGRSFATSQIK